MSRRSRGILLVVLGLFLLLAGTGLYFTYERQDELAGKSSGILLQELEREIKFSPPQESLPLPERNPAQEQEEDPEPVVPTRTLSGYDLMGILRIPNLGIELPVLSTWSYSLLNVAPCRYSGSVETGDLVILGHNYRSHFYALKQAAVGDTVEFTDAGGVTHRYVVAEVEIIGGSESGKLPSDYPLTIFTCTSDSRHRIVVRCAALDGV